MRVSVPEPPPLERGIVVPTALCTHILKHPALDAPRKQALIALVSERDAFGRAKYGQPLMSLDGRNGVEDARQEAGDLLQYAFKLTLLQADEKADDVAALRALLADVFLLVDEMLKV